MIKKISEIIAPMFQTGFTPDESYYEIFGKGGLIAGRMLSGSKSSYYDQHPDNLVVFNSNIITKKSGKIWFGDLDITLDFDTLKDIADKLQEDLYILREMDARFENENLIFSEYKKNAIAIITYNR